MKALPVLAFLMLATCRFEMAVPPAVAPVEQPHAPRWDEACVICVERTLR